jgi:uncharacterized protein
MKSKFVFINMATSNVAAAREFYDKLGFGINEDYSSDQGVFIVLGDNVQLILSTEAFLQQLGEQREFADASKVTEASLAISVGSREEVDQLVEAAINAGGKQVGGTPQKEETGPYARAFTDLDGHKIDVNHMPA